MSKNRPKLCVESLIQRGNDLVVACLRDRPELERVGLQWLDVNTLLQSVNVCADAQASWLFERRELKIATARNERFLLQCRRFRTELADDLRNAFKAIELNIVIPGFTHNLKAADLTQDLIDLAVYCTSYKEQLQAVYFDSSNYEKACTVSREIEDRASSLHLGREILRHQIVKARNRAYTKLKKQILHICTFGRRAFKDDSLRKRDYRTIK